jgi:undecaprenyl-diphosphatase
MIMAQRVRGRDPRDVLRVVVGAVVLAVAVSVRAGRVGRLEVDVVRLVDSMPRGLSQPPAVIMQLGAIGAVPVVALVALAARRVWLARDLAVAGTVAWLLAKLVGGLVDGIRPAGLSNAMLARATEPGSGFPSSHVAVAAALATAAAPYLPRLARLAAWVAVALVGVASVHAGGGLAVGALAGAALGRVLRIEEAPPPPDARPMRLLAAQAPSGPATEPGETTLWAAVTVTWALDRRPEPG